MWEYFNNYYIERNIGPGWVVTTIFSIIALVLLLYKGKRDAKNIRKMILHMVILWGINTVICSFCYHYLGHNMWSDRCVYVVLMGLYAALISKYKPSTRLVRCFIFFSCMMQTITISEPIGEWFEDINADWTWTEHLTWIVVVLMEVAVIWFIHIFDTDKLTFVPKSQVYLSITVSVIGVILQLNHFTEDDGRRYMVLVAGCMWILDLIAYYVFYHASSEYDWKLEMLAEHHKQELDKDLMEFSTKNYKEMHEIRHEVKNHLAYISALNDQKEYDKLTDYLGAVMKETEKMFTFIECGNSVANAVMNHSVMRAKDRNIIIEPLIIIPPDLPYKDTDFCSLLSNLMENAMEASAQSGEKQPHVTVNIRPQQDYLFIRVTNPVNHDIAYHKRLTLHTTKDDKQSHGYGTGIIRKIAQKYQGTFNCSIKDGRFIADVMLSLEAVKPENSNPEA